MLRSCFFFLVSSSSCRCSSRDQSVSPHSSGGGKKCVSEVYVDGWDGDYSPVGQRRRSRQSWRKDHHLRWLSGYQPSTAQWCWRVHLHCQQPHQCSNCHAKRHCVLWVYDHRCNRQQLWPQQNSCPSIKNILLQIVHRITQHSSISFLLVLITVSLWHLFLNTFKQRGTNLLDSVMCYCLISHYWRADILSIHDL